ncbi:MAG: MTH1187 family thiamine-binding protein [Cyanobacteria bacterium NC_groundwater_1444_Ag_S-0.65um_54_12]|nr:MTH1187 family thiamine-binding protein [Cyanobacteria bacterium NC_groundwater_1444_Ag_S-0.65um_54_12]
MAELSVIPLAGMEMKPYIDAAVEVIKRQGLRYEVGALGTTMEGELEQILEVLKQAHQAVLAGGSERVITELRIDECRSGGHSMAREVTRYR